MQNFNDRAAATDLLLAAKSGVRNCAYAITESASPNVRQALSQQLQQSINFHEQVTNYMMDKGYYHPYNLNEQLQIDQQAVQQTMQQPNQ
ncbi:spore coat protein [Alteribacillus bidgolensis]|uniref:Similar to spore coat protein n=1 Tax=Alteribacillus bidgolensis TaxID=930129 RepID=A0A1G8CUF5_9BACI|nr:spore coat protein [Alteribacillus bidgolensis]SDH49142.1 similar to spore coat protein [Alteribacillus bidgolensis]